jgi:hypothetical protein
MILLVYVKILREKVITITMVVLTYIFYYVNGVKIIYHFFPHKNVKFMREKVINNIITMYGVIIIYNYYI